MKENFYVSLTKSTTGIGTNYWQRWRKILLVLVTLLAPFGAQLLAQSYVSIGSQEIDLEYYESSPVNSYYESSRLQIIYTASEINAAGGSAGNIEQIAWNVTEEFWGGALPGYTIYMGHTTETAFDGYYATGLTEVKSAFDYDPELGIHDITLDTPFNWDGTSNIVVEICFGTTTYNPDETAFGRCWAYLGEVDSYISEQADEVNLCGTEDFPFTGDYKPCVRFFMQTQTCLPPSGLLSSITPPNSGVLTWTAPEPNPTSYDIYVTTDAGAPNESTTPTATGVTETTYTIDNLTPGNTYAYVRSNCEGSTSAWVATSLYLGYCQVTSTNTSYGISNVTTTGGYTNVSNTSGPGTYSDYTLQTVSMSAGGTVNFTVQPVAGTNGIGIWIDWNQDYDFNDANEQIYNSNAYVSSANGTITVPDGTPDGSYRMRVVANWLSTSPVPCGNLGSAGYGEAEDYTFVVSPAPACPQPVTIAAAVSGTSVTVTWTELSTPSNGYEYVISTSNTLPTDAGTPVTGLTVTVNDLIPGTTYYVFVRANCGSEFSTWISTSFYVGYCQVTSFSTTYGIANFSTTDAITNINNTTGANGYSDYTAQAVTSYASGAFNFSVTTLPGTHGIGIWIDWNNDMDFSDSGEQVYMSNAYVSSANGTINVPVSLAEGNYRIRVVANWLSTSPTPCGNLGSAGYGEAEDYTLTIAAPPSCAPPTALNGLGVQSGSSTITWTASPSSGVQGYEWIVVALGGAPTDTPIASGTTASDATSATATGLTDFTSYTVYVRTICDGGNSAWAGPFNLPGPCTTAVSGQYPGGTYQPTCNGTVNTITTCAFASEYSVVQVENGVDYTFGISVLTDIITIASADGSVVYAVGTGGSVTWTSTIDGTVRFYTHTANCGSQSTCRVKTVLCGEPWVNEADIQILYTLGGLPMVYGDNHIIQAVVTNPAEDTWTKDITLEITGANTFTSVYQLTLAGGETQTISFDPFTPTNLGLQTVTVSVEDDNVNSNNTYSVEQLVTPNIFSHKQPDLPMADGGVGIGGGYTGNFVAKFTTAVPADINEIKVDFAGDGGVAYQYRIFAADGPGGLPGTILFDSPQMTSVPGQAFLPVSPAVTVTGDFYVGLRELGTNFQFNYQVEDPLRTGIFYFNTEDGTFPWTDISTSGAPTAKLAIEAQIYSETAPNCPLSMLPINGASICHMGDAVLSWNSGGGAPTGYHLYFGTDENPPLIGDFTTTTYTVEDLVENTVYYWYVVPFNEFGEADTCEIYSFTAGMGGCFCDPTYTTGISFGDMISNVVIEGTTLSNNSGTDTSGPYYTYFTGQPNYTAELQAGTSYNMTVTVGSFGQQNVAVWIDFNDNGAFEENERVGYTTAPIMGFGTATFPIVLSCTAPLGTHRMRVRDVYFTAGISIDPCASYGFGETEDYDITITAPPACPAPSGGQIVDVTDISATLTWNAGCTETQWDVHVAESGSGIPTGAPSHPNVTAPLLIEGLTNFTNYEFWVMAICSDTDSSSWAGPFYFSTLLMPPPVNDNPCGAIALPISEECNNVIGTNENASNTQNVPNPTCSFYDGSDVWFSVVVPGNGLVTITTSALDISDAGMAVYSAASCTGPYTQIACDDDSGDGFMPLISLTGQTPGATLYVRVFAYANNEIGTFNICATSPCSAPVTTSITVDVVNNTATISWPSMGPDASYNWELRESGTAGSGDIGLIESGTTDAGVTTVTITDLNYLSIYNFYVNTICSATDTSDWSSAVEVVTGPLPGCTDPLACNYNVNAGVDDGSCIMEETTWYQDADGDGYGNPAVSQVACEGPAGYVHDNTDCDDTDNTKWQSTALYIDADGDGYDAGTEVVCYGSTIPSGYAEESLGNDCNDNNPNSWGQETLDVTLTLLVNSVCNTSAAFTLTGGSPAGGTWSSSSAGLTGSLFNPAVAGVGAHTITYTVAGDGICTIGGSASAVLNVTLCPGVDEVATSEISLYPTYTNGNVNVVGKDLKEAIIMDINGKVIHTESLIHNSIVPMHTYAAGIYFIRVVGYNQVKTFKVTKVN